MKAILVPQDKKGWSKGEIIEGNGNRMIATEDCNIHSKPYSDIKAQRLTICDEKADIKPKDGQWFLEDGKLYQCISLTRFNANAKPQIVLASFPALSGCYSLTSEDVKWWVENGMPENVELVMSKSYPNCVCGKSEAYSEKEEKWICDKRVSCQRLQSELYEPKITNNCIELIKSNKIDMDKAFEKWENNPLARTIKEQQMKRENKGFDFKGWSEAINSIDLSKTFRDASTQPQQHTEDDVEEVINDEFQNKGTNHELHLIALLRFIENHVELQFDPEGHLRLNKTQIVKNFLNTTSAKYREKSDAVEFGEWLHCNQFVRYVQSKDGAVPFGKNKNTKESVWISTKIHYSPDFYTTQELYQIYLKQKEGI